MPEDRSPTLDEFWERLEARAAEDDLKQELKTRVAREQGSVSVGDERTVVAVVERLIPGDVPARALAVFLDQVFGSPRFRGR